MNPNVLRRWIKESESSSGPVSNERKPMTIDDSSGFVALPIGKGPANTVFTPGIA
jgi:hypothetical protein